ncbi:MAG TPA: hypothetical protein VEJ46_17010 [Candidatus Acidoferrum sp.]|nr:hypothetical protein [Candidatus Acidoferrum sp.]
MKGLYSVAEPFKAMTAVSGRERQFRLGESFLCDPEQNDAKVVIEFDEFLFLVDRSTFEACCVFKGGFAA